MPGLRNRKPTKGAEMGASNICRVPGRPGLKAGAEEI
jgi:hypothetical protein